MLKDNYNRKISYLRVSLTEACNLKCIYCTNVLKEINLRNSRGISDEEIFKIVQIASTIGIKKIRLTGGEPLLRKNIIKIIKKIKTLKGVEELSLSTNGVLLEEYVKDLRTANLDRINVSLDTLDAQKFKFISGEDKINNVIAGIQKAKSVGFNVIKINVVVLKGINDNELADFITFGMENNLIIRFIEFMPLGNKNKWHEYYVSRDEMIKNISWLINFDVMPVQDTNAPSIYLQLKRGGIVGFISPISHNFCGLCNRLRLTADGYLRVCLAHNIELNIVKLLRENASIEVIKRTFEQAANLKPQVGMRRDININNRDMRQIGG